MVTKYAIKHLNGNIEKTLVCKSHADEVRDDKKHQALLLKSDLINKLNEEIEEILKQINQDIELINESILKENLKETIDQTIIDELNISISLKQAEIDSINSDKALRLSTINSEYDITITEANSTYNIEFAAMIPNGFIEVGKSEFDKIDVKEYVTFDHVSGKVSNKSDRPLLENTDLNKKRIADIKKEAGKIINNVVPLSEGKQTNLLAQYNELNETLIDVLISILNANSLITPTVQAQIDTIKADKAVLQNTWNWVKSVRQTSNDAETNGTALNAITWPV